MVCGMVAARTKMRNQDHYPLFEVKTDPDLGFESLFIIAKTSEKACARVRQLFRKKRLANPTIVSVLYAGTIDFMPVVKRRYFNV
jgi:hypothetical protein